LLNLYYYLEDSVLQKTYTVNKFLLNLKLVEDVEAGVTLSLTLPELVSTDSVNNEVFV